jgi:hypothetical protein
MLIDSKTIEQARNADIIAFLEKYNGFTFAHQSGAYRCQQHKSLAVKADRRSFYWHSKGVGGFGVLDFLTKVENMPFRDAVEAITGAMPITAQSGTPRNTEYRLPNPPKKLVLPEKSGLQLRLYDYLCKKRGIDSDIVNTLVQKEMLYEDRRGNVVFVGYDEHKKARFACLRGTHGDCSFRGDCAGSDKRYGFSAAASSPSERLYIYESAIDLMSYASLVNAETGDTNAWKQHNYLSLSGTSETAIPFFLNRHTEVKEIVFCLDNDPAGREAAVSMTRKYADKGYYTRLELPTRKDFNEDLIAYNTAVHNDKSKSKGEFNDR